MNPAKPLNKRDLESLLSIIARLEDWQRRVGEKQASVSHEINQAKSRLLDAARRLG